MFLQSSKVIFLPTNVAQHIFSSLGLRYIECVTKLQRDQNNPFFQRFSTGFDVLTTNTSPLDPVLKWAKKSQVKESSNFQPK